MGRGQRTSSGACQGIEGSCGSEGPDHAAADPGAGVAGGLSGKVVGVAVDDDGAPNDIRNGKTVGQDAEVCLSPAAEQGRQVPPAS